MNGERMSNLHDPQTRIMLKSYEQQLKVARHLAQHKVRSRIRDALLEGDMELRDRLEMAMEPVDPDPAGKRGAFVKSAAEALFMSLIFTGNTNPITETIRNELSKTLDKDVEFTYPPGGKMRLVVREGDGMRALTEEEQRLITPVLKKITSQEVDKSMHGNSGRLRNNQATR